MLSLDWVLMLVGAGTTVSILITGSRFRIVLGVFAIWGSGLLVACMQLAGGRGAGVDLLAWLGFGWLASAIACALADIILVRTKQGLRSLLRPLSGSRAGKLPVLRGEPETALKSERGNCDAERWRKKSFYAET